jgi:gas vesicle protein
MKFVVGLLSGVVIGAVGAVAYSVQSGKDLREAYESVRSDLSARDLDALGARVEKAVADMQVVLDAQIADVKAKVEAVTAARRGEGAQALSDAADTVEAAASDVAETASEAVSDAAEAVSDAADKAQQAGA